MKGSQSARGAVRPEYARLVRRVRQAARRLARARLNLPTEHLPWRAQRTPYRVFLAEMLLVRTRADVVARVFEEVVQRYPTPTALARADEEALTQLLSPLGYRKRVPLLRRAGKHLAEVHGSTIPGSVRELLAIPGVWDYTAAAVAAFAHAGDEVPEDVNILRTVRGLSVAARLLLRAIRGA